MAGHWQCLQDLIVDSEFAAVPALSAPGPLAAGPGRASPLTVPVALAVPVTVTVAVLYLTARPGVTVQWQLEVLEVQVPRPTACHDDARLNGA